MTKVLSITQQQQDFTFINVKNEPVLSVLRGFSAPVSVNMPRSNTELAFLMANDQDSFSRWDAGQLLLINTLLDLTKSVQLKVLFICFRRTIASIESSSRGF